MLSLSVKGVSNIVSNVIIVSVILLLSITSIYTGLQYLGVLEHNLRSSNIVDFLRYLRLELNRLLFVNDSVKIFNPHYQIRLENIGRVIIYINDICLGNYTLNVFSIPVYSSSPPVFHDSFIHFDGVLGSIYQREYFVYLLPSISVLSMDSNVYLKFAVITGVRDINGDFILKVQHLMRIRYTFESNNGVLIKYFSSLCNGSEILPLYGIVNVLLEVIFIEVFPL